MATWLSGKYLGTDIVPQFVEHARNIAGRTDWHFETTNGTAIPEQDNCADFVVFFSVFTHVSHEQTYQYLAEAKRILKSGGKIVFSFIEFSIADHWSHFTNSLHSYANDLPLNVFLGRDAIEAFSRDLGLKIESIIDGNKPHIPINHEITFSSGAKAVGMAKLGPIGQSVCVMKKI